MNTIELFEELDIPYKASGKNISRGWVGVPCPYPFCSDPSDHMGVHVESGRHNCWVCGSKGDMKQLLHHMLKMPYQEVVKLLRDYGWTRTAQKAEEQPSSRVIKSIQFPDSCTRTLPLPHKKYLTGRGFNPEDIQREYKIRACWTRGEFSYRIVIPIFHDGVLVNLTGRDITEKQALRYKTLSNEKAAMGIKSCCYNLHTVKDKVVIVEGPCDVWRIGAGAISTFGTAVTTDQMILLLDKNIREAFILFDKGAEKQGSKLASKLSSFINIVELLHIEKGDPADMSDAEADEIKKMLK